MIRKDDLCHLADNPHLSHGYKKAVITLNTMELEVITAFLKPWLTLGLLVKFQRPLASITMGMLRALHLSITIEMRPSMDWLRPRPGPAIHKTHSIMGRLYSGFEFQVAYSIIRTSLMSFKKSFLKALDTIDLSLAASGLWSTRERLTVFPLW